jgi:hypothetical protein
MSSATDEMAALRSKIVQLELKQRIHRMAQNAELMEIKMQAALEKKDQEQKMEKKDLEQKMELMEIKMQASFEKRDQERGREADKKETQHQIENEKRDRLLENEKRDREADKRETQHQIEIENEKRDRLLENEKRDRLLILETEKRDRALENETRDRKHQVAELKSDMRMVQMQQQLEAQAYRTTHHTQPGTCTCNMNLQHAKTAVDAAPQREIELLQRIQLLELRAHDKETERGHLPVSISISPRETSQPVLVTPNSDKDKDQETRSRGHTASVVAPLSVPATHTTYSQPAATAPIQQQITATPPNKPKEQSAKQSSRQTTKTPAAVGRVPLPGNARNHFFLSHCQATGGDQVNAIYLELQQLGFSCW